ncbi:MAG: type II secretion system protein [Planctomycetota bacterium]
MTKKGFTLIELLVVIAIIALLLSVIMPALGKAKELAKGLLCTANLRSLGTAWTAYASENNERIVTGPVIDTVDNPSRPTALGWAAPPLLADGSKFTTVTTITYEDRIRGIQHGKLYDYLGDPEVYHCPGDRRMKDPDPAAQRYRSYLLPDALYGDMVTSRHAAYKKRFGKLVTKITDISAPSSRYTFVESAGQSTDPVWGGFDHGGWKFLPWVNSFWGDPLAANHSESACFAFADGHAERHKWVHKDTSRLFQGELDRAVAQSRLPWPDNKDVAWAWDHYPLARKDQQP